MMHYIDYDPETGSGREFRPLERADLVEVVRCRDCEFSDETESGELRCHGYLVEDGDWYNDMPSDGVKVKPDNFCAWAEKRADDN